jgi:dolichyl-phosphate-mannose--protein O-mannosyl transferase
MIFLEKNKVKKTIIFMFSIFSILNISLCENMSEEDIKATIESKTITYGSSLRIQNSITKYHLSSFGMNWSSGSGLQIITAVESDKEINSLFTIKEGENYPIKVNGDPVLCGDIIRLEHVSTGKNLHSHDFKSFVTNSQEACGFGDNGDGDVNDNFRISCYKQEDNETITGKTEFFCNMFQHKIGCILIIKHQCMMIIIAEDVQLGDKGKFL